MIDVNVRFDGLDQALRDLKNFREKAVPFAVREGCNVAAHATEMRWEMTLQSELVLRNHWTEKSLRVEHARGLNVRTMIAKVGSISPYLGETESGHTTQARSKHVPIPGPAAAGQAAGSKRKRTVRGAYLLEAVRVTNPAFAKNYGRRRFNAVAFAVAFRTGSQFAVLKRKSGGLGLFKVTAGKRRVRARMLYDLSRSSIHAGPHPTLALALQEMQNTYPIIYEQALVAQCRRWKIAGY